MNTWVPLYSYVTNRVCNLSNAGTDSRYPSAMTVFHDVSISRGISGLFSVRTTNRNAVAVARGSMTAASTTGPRARSSRRLPPPPATRGNRWRWSRTSRRLVVVYGLELVITQNRLLTFEYDYRHRRCYTYARVFATSNEIIRLTLWNVVFFFILHAQYTL